MSFGKPHAPQNDAELGMAAAEWLLRLSDPEVGPEDPYPDPQARNDAFFDWLTASAEHLRVFLEMVETHRRLPLIDAQRLIEIEQLLGQRPAEVIRLYGNVKEESVREQPLESTSSSLGGGRRRMGTVWGVTIAASAAASVLAALFFWITFHSHVYTTAIGEQRSAKLEDGSFIYLNTDSRVEVDFSKNLREIRLTRGEALFVVEHESSRPFVVNTGSADVLAVGTQFNVRRLAAGTDITVIEGVVQVDALGESEPAGNVDPVAHGLSVTAVAPTRLSAGEGARVSRGQVVSRTATTAGDALAWRQRRLIFHDARLADVAEEFNRYNHTKIRIKGEAAQDILLTGIFDADRPQALMLYAAKNDALAVEPQGSDWVIRAK